VPLAHQSLLLQLHGLELGGYPFGFCDQFLELPPQKLVFLGIRSQCTILFGKFEPHSRAVLVVGPVLVD
jgi:hypothetical protein